VLAAVLEGLLLIDVHLAQAPVQIGPSLKRSWPRLASQRLRGTRGTRTFSSLGPSSSRLPFFCPARLV
jgi:hypothetical protein